MDSVDTYRVISILVLFALALVGGVLPIWIQGNKRLLSILNCAAAGVFLAAGFLHLLADASGNEGLEEWSTKDDGKYDFPWPQLFCTIGFLAVFYIEQFALSLQDRQMAKAGLPTTTNHSAVGEEDFVDAEQKAEKSDSMADMAVAGVIFIALSFHSIMEGLGIGAQSDVEWAVFLAVAAHKGLAAFALGAKVLQAKAGNVKTIAAMVAFALMSPIGILIGWAIQADGDDAAASGVAIALASGTFIFVATMELIPHEFNERTDILAKSIALFLGYAIFGMLAKWV